MNDVTATIKHAVNQELERSMELYPCANLVHGSFGVIKEEVLETFTELGNMHDKLKELEKLVYKAKGYPHQMCADEIALVKGIESDAMDAITELIQVAAMCKKHVKAFTYTTLD